MPPKGPSKRVLVYDFAQNKTMPMTRAKFEELYGGESNDTPCLLPTPHTYA